MGIFSRFKRSVSSKANAVVDKAISPEKELELAIFELDKQRKVALQELLSYRTSTKQMEQEIAKHEEQAKEWEEKARRAVAAGEDELATKCLGRRREAMTALGQARNDRDEAAGYAIELNRSRKQVEARLKVLKLKKGTMASQIAAARSGGKSLGVDGELFEKLERAEEAIDEEAIRAEVDAELSGDDDRELDAALAALPAPAEETDRADDPLAALKAKMAEEEQPKLPSGDSE